MAADWSLLRPFLPEMVIGAGVAAMLLWGILFPKRGEGGQSLFALTVLTGAIFSLVGLLRAGQAPEAGSMAAPWSLAYVLRLAIVFAASMVVFLSHEYVQSRRIPARDFYLLLLLATAGMTLTAAAGHLLLLFLGVELTSLSMALLAALNPGSSRSKEAALKYLMYSLTASGLFLFGLSVFWGIWGTWDLSAARSVAVAPGPASGLAVVLILAGLGFKLGLFPFHMWVPDVYDGSPGPVAAFLSVGPKAAALAAAGWLLAVVMSDLAAVWRPLLWVMAVASMVWGNLAALAQRSLRRMMAYSSIAHVGYLAVGLLAASWRPADGLGAMGFYVFGYTFFNLGFFALIVWMEGADGRGPALEDLSGLGRRQPWLGAAFALFLLALAGIPPTAGFMAKFWVFAAAVRSGMVALAVIAILNSVLAAYYYLRVVYYLFMKEPAAGSPDIPEGIGSMALVLASLTTLWLGVWPSPLLEVLLGGMGR